MGDKGGGKYKPKRYQPTKPYSRQQPKSLLSHVKSMMQGLAPSWLTNMWGSEGKTESGTGSQGNHVDGDRPPDYHLQAEGGSIAASTSSSTSYPSSRLTQTRERTSQRTEKDRVTPDLPFASYHPLIASTPLEPIQLKEKAAEQREANDNRTISVEKEEDSDASGTTSGCSSLMPHLDNQEWAESTGTTHRQPAKPTTDVNTMKGVSSYQWYTQAQPDDTSEATNEATAADTTRPQETTRLPFKPTFNSSYFGAPFTNPSRESSPSRPPVTTFGGAAAYRKSARVKDQKTLPSKVFDIPHKRRVNPALKRVGKPWATAGSALGTNTAKKILGMLQSMPTPISDAKKIPLYPPRAGNFSTSKQLRMRGLIGSNLLTTDTDLRARLRQRGEGPPTEGLSTLQPASIAKNRQPPPTVTRQLVSTSRPDDQDVPMEQEEQPKAPSLEPPSKDEEVSEKKAATFSGLSSSAGGKMRPSKSYKSLRGVPTNSSQHRAKMPGLQDNDSEDVGEMELPSGVPLPLAIGKALPSFNFEAAKSKPLEATTSSAAPFSFTNPGLKNKQGDKDLASKSLAKSSFVFSSPKQGPRGAPEQPPSPSLSGKSLLSQKPLQKADLEEKVDSTADPDEQSSEGGVKTAQKLKSGSCLQALGLGNTPDAPVASIATTSEKTEAPIPKLDNPFGGGAINAGGDGRDSPELLVVATAATSAPSLAQFKPAAGSWECQACMIHNKVEDSACVSCSTPKPGATAAATLTNIQPTPVSFGGNSLSSLAQFKPATNSWECQACMIRNKAEDSNCVSCSTAKPGAATVLTNPQPTAINFGGNSLSSLAQFKPPTDSWECQTCMIRNKAEDNTCVSCATPKPGATQSSGGLKANSLGGGFSFTSGGSATAFNGTSAPGGFTFGSQASPAGAGPNAGSGGLPFTFGGVQPSNGAADKMAPPAAAPAPIAGGFTFGAPPADSQKKTGGENVLEPSGFTFGASIPMDKKDESKQQSLPSGFRFGQSVNTPIVTAMKDEVVPMTTNQNTFPVPAFAPVCQSTSNSSMTSVTSVPSDASMTTIEGPDTAASTFTPVCQSVSNTSMTSVTSVLSDPNMAVTEAPLAAASSIFGASNLAASTTPATDCSVKPATTTVSSIKPATTTVRSFKPATTTVSSVKPTTTTVTGLFSLRDVKSTVASLGASAGGNSTKTTASAGFGNRTAAKSKPEETTAADGVGSLAKRKSPDMTTTSIGFSFGAAIKRKLQENATAAKRKSPDKTTTGGFGSPAKRSSPNKTTTTTGFNFGAAVNSKPGETTASGGFSFGATAKSRPSETTTSDQSSFATSAKRKPASGVSFGAPATSILAATTGGSFMEPSAKFPAAATSAAPFNFGAGNTAAATTSGGFGFGAGRVSKPVETGTATVFGFGTSAAGNPAATTTATPAASSITFGAPATNNPPAIPQPAGFAFGASAGSAPSNSIFGGATGTPNSAFGSAASTSNSTIFGSGMTASSSIFGGSTAGTPGFSSAQPPSTAGFGTSTAFGNTPFGASAPTTVSGMQPSAASLAPSAPAFGAAASGAPMFGGHAPVSAAPSSIFVPNAAAASDGPTFGKMSRVSGGMDSAGSGIGQHNVFGGAPAGMASDRQPVNAHSTGGFNFSASAAAPASSGFMPGQGSNSVFQFGSANNQQQLQQPANFNFGAATGNPTPAGTFAFSANPGSSAGTPGRVIKKPLRRKKQQR